MSVKKLLPYIIFCFILSLASCHKGPANHDDDNDEHHDHSGIILDSHKAEEFGIQYEEASFQPFHDVIKTSGFIEPSNSDIFTITAKKSGTVRLNPELSPGKSIKKSQSLGSISSEGLQGGDISLAAKANFEAAKAEFERLKPLFEEGLVTASVFREAERAYREAEALSGKGTQTPVASLISPIDGTILSINVKSGDFVETGAPVAIITKNSLLTLKADLPAKETRHLPEIISANFISDGSENVMKLSELEWKRVSGANHNTLNNGYIPVYFTFSSNPTTVAGGFVEVYLLCEERRNVISVPRSALVEIQGNKYIYIREDDHEY